MKTILIVDKDLGFVLWLGHILNAGGSVALPATTIDGAAEMVSRLELRVDILITETGAAGVREFVEELRVKSPDLMVVGLGGDDDEDWATPFFGSVRKNRPRCGDEATRSEWVALIRELDNTLFSAACLG